MAPHSDSSTPHSTPTNWPLVAGILLICGFMSVAVYWATKKNTESQVAGVQRKVEQSNPCVDTKPGRAVRLSQGCRAIVDNINIFCARNSRYCARSEQRAVKLAQSDAVGENFGAVALVGGGGGSGNKPNSPDRPSQPPQGDGQGNGENGQPTPGQPAQPPQGQPDKPSEPPPGQPQPPATPGRETPQGPIIDIPPIIEDTCRLVQTPLGPIIRVCP